MKINNINISDILNEMDDIDQKELTHKEKWFEFREYLEQIEDTFFLKEDEENNNGPD